MYPPLSPDENKISGKTESKKRYVYEKIDWLSITFPTNVKISQIVKYLPKAMLERIKTPIPVYKLAYSYGYVKILAGHHNSGVHVILSGKPLDGIRMIYGYSIENIYKMISELKGKVSRIDFAVDVLEDEKFTVNEVYRRFENNEVRTKLKGSKFIGESGQIETLYIGNMKSKTRKFRVYNKAVEQGDLVRKWVRIEYEKRRGAMASYNAFISGQAIASIIKSAVDFPEWKEWIEIMGDSIATIPRDILVSDDDLINKIQWIEQSAAPAIAKVAFKQYISGDCDDIHDATIFNTLSAAIAKELRILMNSIQDSDEI